MIRDRETCLISNDPRSEVAGPCGWCGDKCGNNNVCEPVKWLKKIVIPTTKIAYNQVKISNFCFSSYYTKFSPNSLKWLDKYIMYLTGCENSGEYSNGKCEGWKYLCDSDQWRHRQFMIDHCSKTCGFCDPGKLISILRNSSMLKFSVRFGICFTDSKLTQYLIVSQMSLQLPQQQERW